MEQKGKYPTKTPDKEEKVSEAEREKGGYGMAQKEGVSYPPAKEEEMKVGKESSGKKHTKEATPPEGGKYEAGTGSFYSATQDVKMERSSTGEPFTGGTEVKGSVAKNVKKKKG